MFTGIITDCGEILQVSESGTAVIATAFAAESLTLGASVACDGVCLTVTGKGLRRDWQSGNAAATPEDAGPIAANDGWEDRGPKLAAPRLFGLGRRQQASALQWEGEDFDAPRGPVLNFGSLGKMREEEVEETAAPEEAPVAQSGRDYYFTVDISAETRARSTLANWKAGQRVNLERALKAGDELGGHHVSGHVDAVGKITGVTQQENGFRVLEIELPLVLAPLVAEKGSITVNGVSLTVNSVAATRFSLTIIPHTATDTNLGGLKAGDSVNLEADMLARYVQRILSIAKTS